MGESWNMYIPINTQLGIISGRDAIYFNEQKFSESPYGMTFTGEIAGALCSYNHLYKEWVPYTLSFYFPIYYVCYELDLYPNGRYLKSSFSLVKESALLTSILEKDITGKFKHQDFKHFVFATYDYVYEIIARDFKLEINIS